MGLEFGPLVSGFSMTYVGPSITLGFSALCKQHLFWVMTETRLSVMLREKKHSVATTIALMHKKGRLTAVKCISCKNRMKSYNLL